MVKILGPDGTPLPAAPRRPRGAPGGNLKPSAMNANYGMTAYDAADIWSPNMAAWRPSLWSADAELNPWRNRIVSRARDAVRNDGWANSGITKILDNVIGAAFRPISKPDYIALRHFTGNKAFDAKWADEFGRAVDACWRTWADDVQKHCDAERCLTMPQLFWTSFRHALIDGDALAQILYRPATVRPGGARYATSVQLIDPDRLSNPMWSFDNADVRGGVQVDKHGAPIGYHIERAHFGNWWSAAESMTWDYIPKETSWGRPIIVHTFEHDRASQHRGGAGILTPVLQRIKMLVKYDGTELDAAIINAIFAAFVKSPYDQQMVEEALGEGDDDRLGLYQDMRQDWWGDPGRRRIMLGETHLTHLFPGEEIGTVSAARPASNFEPFEAAVLRHVAAGMGVTYEQLTSDWSRTNYSSSRGALNEVWKTLDRRRKGFANGFANPIFAAWLEEVMEVDDLPLPAGAPAFEEFRTAFSRCRWIGPGRGWMDPLTEKQGAILGMEAGLSTLEIEAAENAGENWEEMVDQRAVEVERFTRLGMQPPTWSGLPRDPEEGSASRVPPARNPKTSPAP